MAKSRHKPLNIIGLPALIFACREDNMLETKQLMQSDEYELEMD